jgi:hypothetical protein
MTKWDLQLSTCKHDPWALCGLDVGLFSGQKASGQRVLQGVPTVDFGHSSLGVVCMQRLLLQRRILQFCLPYDMLPLVDACHCEKQQHTCHADNCDARCCVHHLSFCLWASLNPAHGR